MCKYFIDSFNDMIGIEGINNWTKVEATNGIMSFPYSDLFSAERLTLYYYYKFWINLPFFFRLQTSDVVQLNSINFTAVSLFKNILSTSNVF